MPRVCLPVRPTAFACSSIKLCFQACRSRPACIVADVVAALMPSCQSVLDSLFCPYASTWHCVLKGCIDWVLAARVAAFAATTYFKNANSRQLLCLQQLANTLAGCRSFGGLRWFTNRLLFSSDSCQHTLPSCLHVWGHPSGDRQCCHGRFVEQWLVKGLYMATAPARSPNPAG